MCGQTHITPMFEIVGDFGIQQPEKKPKKQDLGGNSFQIKATFLRKSS